MPEETGWGDGVTVAAATEVATPATAERFESPPAAAMPARVEVDPRARLHQLAIELVRSQNRRLLVEYLRLRRV
jgi:hypothetical protein